MHAEDRAASQSASQPATSSSGSGASVALTPRAHRPDRGKHVGGFGQRLLRIDATYRERGTPIEVRVRAG